MIFANYSNLKTAHPCVQFHTMVAKIKSKQQKRSMYFWVKCYKKMLNEFMHGAKKLSKIWNFCKVSSLE